MVTLLSSTFVGAKDLIPSPSWPCVPGFHASEIKLPPRSNKMAKFQSLICSCKTDDRRKRKKPIPSIIPQECTQCSIYHKDNPIPYLNIKPTKFHHFAENNIENYPILNQLPTQNNLRSSIMPC